MKLFGKENKIGKHLGGGLFGDVYEIDSNKVIKISPYYGEKDTSFAFNNYIKENTPPYFAKIYSNGIRFSF